MHSLTFEDSAKLNDIKLACLLVCGVGSLFSALHRRLSPAVRFASNPEPLSPVSIEEYRRWSSDCLTESTFGAADGVVVIFLAEEPLQMREGQLCGELPSSSRFSFLRLSDCCKSSCAVIGAFTFPIESSDDSKKELIQKETEYKHFKKLSTTHSIGVSTSSSSSDQSHPSYS